MVHIDEILFRMAHRINMLTDAIESGETRPRKREDEALRRMYLELDGIVAEVLDEKHVVGPSRDEIAD